MRTNIPILLSESRVPFAYGITITSASRKSSLKAGARKAQAVADTDEKRKLSDLAHKDDSVPNESQRNEGRFGRKFVPLGFDSLGAQSSTVCKVVEEYAKRVGVWAGCSCGHVRVGIY